MSRASDAIERLLGIMARLRGPDGCPWDREQTLQTLRPYVLEETYEVLEAIDAGDPRDHCEELGDLLLQIVFQAHLASETGTFEFADVAEAISNKLVSRHPHVFGDADVRDAEGVPREMPALARADRLTEKASRVGFDWPDPGGARAKVAEELAELDEALDRGDRDAVEHELGDVLFAVANLGRKVGVPPEEALRGAVARFVSRFSYVERELARRGVPHGEATLAEMDTLWDEAKALEARAKSTTSTDDPGSARGLGKERG